MNAKMDQILADASTMREESVSRLAELESMIAEAEANKTTRDTTTVSRSPSSPTPVYADRGCICPGLYLRCGFLLKADTYTIDS